MADPAPAPSLSSTSSLGSISRSRLHSYLKSTFYRPDLEALDVVFAAIRAHHFRGTKPIWLWVVGLSGSGKTEIAIQAISGLPGIREMGQFSTKSLVSAKRGQGGGILYKLPKIGDRHNGILCWKDFTSFLSMRREDRTEVMAQFREVADGRWTRDTGERSAQNWEGKVSVIAACTHALEIAWSVNRNMGDRFINIQWRDGDDEECAKFALAHAGHEDEIAATVRSLGRSYFGTPSHGETPPPIPPFLNDALIQISLLACWLRRTVHRDEYSHKIDDVPPPEKPTRMMKSIAAILSGNAAVQSREVCQSDLTLAYRIAMDSVSNRRFRIVDILVEDEEFDLVTLRHLSGHARTTLQRELDELEEIGILTVSKQGSDGGERVVVRLTEKFSQQRSRVLCLIKP